MPPHEFKTFVKTRFVSHVIFFQETLEFKHIISFCYGKKTALAFQACTPFLQVWAIAQIVANTLGRMFQ
jgi:hypothetical protein